MKKVNARKADREEHTANAIADALFRATLKLRFRRKGESQVENVTKRVNQLLEGRGEGSMRGFIITGDHGDREIRLIGHHSRKGIGSMFLISGHVKCCHPFVPPVLSYYKTW